MLMVALALPAVQAHACHPVAGNETAQDSAMSGMDMAGMPGHFMPDHHAPAHRPTPQSMLHDCLGCIAPLDIGVYRPAEGPSLTMSEGAGIAPAAFHLSRASAPEPPPPRTLA